MKNNTNSMMIFYITLTQWMLLLLQSKEKSELMLNKQDNEKRQDVKGKLQIFKDEVN